ncbi:MAG: DUF420 domain-containing protein [Pyrinomonadaceae bacterium]|nr:DUF420 domain-containing protein [Pyrinomonadaceae bacterium]
MNSTHINTRAAVGGIIALSAAATAFLFWLIYFKPTPPQLSDELSFLPALNAVLNGLSAISMCVGVFHVSKGRWQTHRRWMITALIFSTLFLASYILHHSLHGDTPFQGAGIIRPVYFFILITHVLLSIVALPLVLVTVFFSLTERFRLHKKLARLTFPIWLYVSVTGVVVFLLLKIYTI